MENFMKMKTTYKLLFLVITIVLTTNCNKDTEPIPENEPDPDDEIAYVINEGQWTHDNGSITQINQTKKTFSSNYFKAVNGFQLGDVVQSMGETDDNYYIVVNSSAKIEVVKKTSFESILTIEDMGSPRYFLAINDTLAYVTDGKNKLIHQINPKSGNKYQNIQVYAVTDQMESIDNEVFVLCRPDVFAGLFSNPQVGIFNVASQSQTDSILLDLDPLEMVRDKFNKLWVLGSVFGGGSKLYKIDGAGRNIEMEWLFQDDEPITQLTIDPEGANIYFSVSNNKIFKMDVNETELPSQAIIVESLQTIYGLSVNKEEIIFVCDAKDYVQEGKVYMFDNNGQLSDTLTSGVAPNGIIFTD